MSTWVEGLRSVMDREGLTQRTTAKRLGVSCAYINDLLHNRRVPSARVAVRAEKVLGLNAQFYFNDKMATVKAEIAEAMKRERRRTSD